MSDDIPAWLSVMRGITGLTEAPGAADNPKILAMATKIGETFPDMAEYCAQYQHDATPWCGLSAGYCMAMCGIRPPFGPTDTDRFLWALSWDDPGFGIPLTSPRLGCVVVMTRSGGGHVTLYESTQGNSYRCRGGNQGDMVNVSSYPIGNVVALVWPKAGGEVPQQERRELSLGDSGDDVASVQRTLGLPADGAFGPLTESGVKGYQAACGLAKDGVVGPNTWAALDGLDARNAAGDNGISDELARAIVAVVMAASDVWAITWPDRGKPPSGYYQGMAETFALALTRYQHADAAAVIMAEAAGNPDTDALAWYADEFARQGMSNDRAGPDTLRHLFVLMVGLGMRESSGVYCEGRDMSASNTSSTTAEAGLFQSSWNLNACSETIPGLLAEYTADPNGFLPTFARGIVPVPRQIDNYGSGDDGTRYQWLAKYSPAFAALMTAVGLRRLRKHWGPIARREVMISPAVDAMLADVQALVEAQPAPEPVPPELAEVVIEIKAKGNVNVTVYQSEPEA